MRKNVILLGAGGMAREVLEGYISLGKGHIVMGYVINTGNGGTTLFDRPVYDQTYLDTIDKQNTMLLAAIGSPVRQAWIDSLEQKGFVFDTFVHPTASVGSSVRLEKGIIICAGAVLTADVVVGKHAIVNALTSISHDAEIGAYSTIGPGSSITGHVRVGTGVFAGAGVTVKPSVFIGDHAYIGSGANVVGDIRPGMLAYGNPAREIRHIDAADWETLV